MNPLKKLLGRIGKPQGFLGRLMLSAMNSGDQAKLAVWGLLHVPLMGGEKILDCGCGGGANVRRMLQLTENGKVYGLDFSPESVEKSRKVNARAIAAGRCCIVEGSAAAIPLDDGMFDLVTAFETVYFWQDGELCFREVYRVLKEDGTFLIVHASGGRKKKAIRRAKMVEGMRLYRGEELEKMLTAAGFTRVEIDEDEKQDRLCVKARK